MDILQLGHPSQRQPGSQSLESEVNAYLADETVYVSLLGWWQVCLLPFYFYWHF